MNSSISNENSLSESKTDLPKLQRNSSTGEIFCTKTDIVKEKPTLNLSLKLSPSKLSLLSNKLKPNNAKTPGKMKSKSQKNISGDNLLNIPKFIKEAEKNKTLNQIESIPEIVETSSKIVLDARKMYRRMVLRKEKPPKGESPFPSLYARYLSVDAQPKQHKREKTGPDEIDPEKEQQEKLNYINQMLRLIYEIENEEPKQEEKKNVEAAHIDIHRKIDREQTLKKMEELKILSRRKEEKERKVRALVAEVNKLISLYKLNPKYVKMQEKIKLNSNIVYNDHFQLKEYQKMLTKFVGKNARKEYMGTFKKNQDQIYNLSSNAFIKNYTRVKSRWDYFLEEIEGACPNGLLEKLKSFSDTGRLNTMRRKRDEEERRELLEKERFLAEVNEERRQARRAQELAEIFRRQKERELSLKPVVVDDSGNVQADPSRRKSIKERRRSSILNVGKKVSFIDPDKSLLSKLAGIKEEKEEGKEERKENK